MILIVANNQKNWIVGKDLAKFLNVLDTETKKKLKK